MLRDFCVILLNSVLMLVTVVQVARGGESVVR